MEQHDEETLKLINKPNFKEGQPVSFNASPDCYGSGRIRGKAVTGLVDIWIIEVLDSNIDEETYPWSCITMPHTLIKAE